jgi:hypothetical protein
MKNVIIVLCCLLLSSQTKGVDPCKDSLYRIACSDTAFMNTYFVGLRIKATDGRIYKAITNSRYLWVTFQENGYAFEDYLAFMIDVLRNKKVIDQTLFKDPLPYIDARPNKENQEVLKKGVLEAYQHMLKSSLEFPQFSSADIIYEFWQLGIGIKSYDQTIHMEFNCFNLDHSAKPKK